MTATAERAASAPPDADEPPSTLLQRVILPRPVDPIVVRSLYLDETTSTTKRVWPPVNQRKKDPRDVDLMVRQSIPNARRARVLSRTAVQVPEQTEVSFASYFNAFPASYWRRWSTLSKVHLRVDLDGPGRIDVYRSNAAGASSHAFGTVLPGDRAELDIELDLTPFGDGGWYWFDLSAEDTPVVVHAAGWYSPTEAPGRAAITVGMPTFNRPQDCVATLQAIGEDPLVRSAVTAVVIPDQGTSKVRDQEGFAAAEAGLQGRLRLIDQANLGGSGGYARVMYEALENTDCEYILYMDDDIVLEPDSILRAVQFARFAKNPMLVGGQMLAVQNRSKLHVMGEVVDRVAMQWSPVPNFPPDHDFSQEPLRDTEWLHRRADADYNAWWMCMIPRVVAEQIGLPLPLFIKWDDVEYGLRAKDAGFPTATVPGIGIWHMAFGEKDDSTDWQSYFHTRNRLVATALYCPLEKPMHVLMSSLKASLKRGMMMQYSTLAVQEMAIRDFMAGPEALWDQLPTAMPAVRKLCAEYEDGRVLGAARDLPEPSQSELSIQRDLRPPTNPVTIGWRLAKGLLHQLKPVAEEHHRRPQLNLANQDAQWFLLSKLDGATVSTADGRGVTYPKRDPQLFKQMLQRSVRLHVELAREYPALRRRYRDAIGDLTSRESWKRAFTSS